MSGNSGTINLYLCYTTFHIMIARYIADEQGEVRNILVDANGHYHARGDEGEMFHEILLKQVKQDFSHTNRLTTQFAKAVNARQLLQLIMPLIASCEKIRVFYAHLDDYLSNYLFFKYHRHPRWEFNLIQDGMLNYHEVTVRGRQRLTHQLKQIIAFLTGFRFTPYHGYLSGVEREEITAQYLLGLEKYAIYSEKAKTVPRPPVHNGPRGEDILILGQETNANMIGKGTYLALFAELADYAVEQRRPSAHIYYKAHHINPVRTQVTRILAARGIEDLSVPGTAEELLMDDTRIGHVIARNSTVLITAKLLFGEHIDCSAFGFRAPSEREDQQSAFRKLAGLFQQMGVDIVE